jgi:hypothetical protein
MEVSLGARHGLFSYILYGLIAAFRALILILLIVWATLAIYYSNLPWPWLRLAAAIAFAAFAIWALWLSRPRRTLAFLILFACVVAWWFT